MRMMLDTSGISTGFQQVGRDLKGLDKQVLALGKSLGITFGAASVGMVLKNAMNTINEYSSANSRLAAILGTVKSETVALQKVQQDLGASTKFTASQVADAQTELAKLGFTQREIIASTAGVLDLAAAAGIEIARAAEVAGGTLRGFGLDASETGRVVDVMAASFGKSALDTEKFAESMKVVAPIAKAAGIDLETATALVGKLSDSMISGSLGGTALKNLLSELSNPTSKLSKEIGFAVKNSSDLFRAFDILKEKNIDLAEATELTDERSKAAFLTLINSTDGLKSLASELENASGSAKQLAETMQDNLSGDIDKAKSAWEGFILSIESGEGAISKAFRTVVQGGTEVLSTLRMLNEESANIEKLGINRVDIGNARKAALTTELRLIEKINATNDSEERAGLIAKVSTSIQQRTAALEELRKKQEQIGNQREETRALLNTAKSRDEIAKLSQALVDLQNQFSSNGEAIVRTQFELEGISRVYDQFAEKNNEATTTVQKLTEEQKAAALEARNLRMELEGWKQITTNDLFSDGIQANIGGLAQGLQELFAAGVIGAGELELQLAKVGSAKTAVLESTFELQDAFAELYDVPELETYTENLQNLALAKEQAKVQSELLSEQLALEKQRMQEIGGVLKNVFEAGLNDFENFGEAIGSVLKRLITQLASAAAAAALLNAFLPGAGGFGSIFGSLSGFSGLSGGGSGALNVNGMIQGRDIFLSNANSGNILNRVGA